MISKNTKIKISDNSGVDLLKCFCIYKGTKRSKASIRDLILGSVHKKSKKYTKFILKLNKSRIEKAVIVSTKKK